MSYLEPVVGASCSSSTSDSMEARGTSTFSSPESISKTAVALDSEVILSPLPLGRHYLLREHFHFHFVLKKEKDVYRGRL